MIAAKAFHLLGHRSAAEVRTAADNNSGGLATRVRVHDVDTFDSVEHIRGAIFNTWFAQTHEETIRSSRGRHVSEVHYSVSQEVFASEFAERRGDRTRESSEMEAERRGKMESEQRNEGA